MQILRTPPEPKLKKIKHSRFISADKWKTNNIGDGSIVKISIKTYFFRKYYILFNILSSLCQFCNQKKTFSKIVRICKKKKLLFEKNNKPYWFLRLKILKFSTKFCFDTRPCHHSKIPFRSSRNIKPRVVNTLYI